MSGKKSQDNFGVKMSLRIAIFFKKRRSNQDITPACFSLELGKVNFCGCIQYSLFQKSNDRFFFSYFT